MTKPDEPAFFGDCGSLTKREYFAAMAMAGISFWDAAVNEPIETGKLENLARSCVGFADALIDELNKSKEAL